jgi:hypothetical protein
MPYFRAFPAFFIIQARLEQQHVVLQALLSYKILQIFYQEVKEITIFFVVSYPFIILGIRAAAL